MRPPDPDLHVSSLYRCREVVLGPGYRFAGGVDGDHVFGECAQCERVGAHPTANLHNLFVCWGEGLCFPFVLKHCAQGVVDGPGVGVGRQHRRGLDAPGG